MSNIYKCEVCGNIVTLVLNGGGELVCCGKPMVKQIAKKNEEGTEKHKPVLAKTDSGILVKIGSIDHPMINEHYIMFVQLLDGENIIAGKQFKPGDIPHAIFNASGVNLKARAFCNIHGLWESD